MRHACRRLLCVNGLFRAAHNHTARGQCIAFSVKVGTVHQAVNFHLPSFALEGKTEPINTLAGCNWCQCRENLSSLIAQQLTRSQFA